VDTGDRLLTPGEVAALFRVDPKTVTRWAAAGRIGSIRTPGGHRRFRESEVRALLEGELGELEEEEGGRPGPASGNTGGHAGGGAGAPSGRGSNSGSHGNPGPGSAVAGANPGPGGASGTPVNTRPLGAPGPPGMH
jgi:excisionase family DNA binding protein